MTHKDDCYSACELLGLLKNDLIISINGNQYDLADITDLIDIEVMREFAQESVAGEDVDIDAIYIKVITDLTV